MRALEGGFGTVFYLDMDAVIFDMGRKVWVDYVELFRGGGATARSVGSADIIMTSDWGGPNSGVMIVSNTDWYVDRLASCFSNTIIHAATTHAGARGSWRSCLHRALCCPPSVTRGATRYFVSPQISWP